MSKKIILGALRKNPKGLTASELKQHLPDSAVVTIRVQISQMKAQGVDIRTERVGRVMRYRLENDALMMGLKYAKYAHYVEQVGMTMYLATSEQYAMHQDRAAVIAADIAVIERGMNA